MSHFHVVWSDRKSAGYAAGTLSLLAHVAVLAAFSSGHANRDAPPSIGRRVGEALMVRVMAQVQTVPPSPVAQFSEPIPSPPHRQATAQSEIKVPPETPHTKQPVDPSPQEGNTDLPSAPANPSPPLPTTAPASTPPGATFANLFAPIISRPMGRGRWGAPPPRIEPPQDHDLIRQQALQARRDQLTQTLRWLETQLYQTPLNNTCQVHVALSQTAGTATCSDSIDQNRITQVLTGFLSEEQSHAIPPEICLTLANSRIEWTPCPQVSATIK